ncbi:TrmH family RNA methyltransferase [Suipraeoptans intestinalis]|uniref:RNA methyltransferase n=1 Tax=Suipraeoptans intestinalis TaxID=2606628 RepID=A0A6N7V1K4_9FIRM|nr:RNA methyltransferase [Suipraeoptans intestinalis]MDD7770855.1 RNA methyltransferase [Suipraeoptans intestinalis]MDY3122478.1 RNA methyltransferase [Suipraeoptans intestinalis]MSR93736.1 RNA methyltransferase [Suipraeoptans intestinalis]
MITSTSNGKVKRLIQLKKKKKCREEEGVFLAEGSRMAKETPAGLLREIYVSESFLKKQKELAKDLENRCKAGIEILADRVFEYVSDTQTPQGVLCVVQKPCHALAEIVRGECPQLLLLEGIQDPGNLGTILRTAEGAGVSGVLLDEACADLFAPKTIRSTMGSVFRLPFVRVADLKEAIHCVKASGIRLYAAHLEGSLPYYQQDFTKPCGFLLGNEGNGLKEETAALADARIKIPMQGQVESLNVGIAAAVLSFEASRQRSL